MPTTPHLWVDANAVTTTRPGPGGPQRVTSVATACGAVAELDEVTMRRDRVRCPDCTRAVAS